ncbi:MAG TPA: glycosyltransferase family 2 protein [Casimicrobiaceae bacterium]|nr:glycosyltransferase family 2 protein [Casimicrobiaceae bacterium]
MALHEPRIAVLIPCYNEALTVGRVIADFRKALPDSTIYVYDNRSTDGTGDLARAAGARVRREMRPGKGVVVRRMFAEIDADIYVITDGDATYDATRAPEMVAALVNDDLDLVTGLRDDEGRDAAYRRGHRFGNRAFNALLGVLFGERPTDMFSGYRVLSRRFVKSFPMEARGFEIETELTVHALELRVPTAEIRTRYFERPEGSSSKLSTYRDGARILATMARLFRDVKPLPFFSVFAAVFAIAGLALGAGVVVEFMETGLVPRLPSAVLATGLMLLASLSFACGMILDSVARGRREAKRLAFLAAGAIRDR